MNKTILIVLATSCLTLATTAGDASADKPIHAPGRMGIGIGGGTLANGLSFKYYTTSSTALQLNAGSFGSGSDRGDFGGLAVSADFLLERGPLVASSLVNLDWSIGLGAGLGTRNDASAAAAAGVIGLEANFNVLPIDLVLEYRPTLLIHPDVDFDAVDFSGHLRFYFQ